MNQRLQAVALPLVCAVALVASGCGGSSEPDTAAPGATGELPRSDGKIGWPAWGGPNRDFRVQGEPLAGYWPKEGPPLLWSRKLGGGYSAIAAAEGLLYAMYRIDRHDVAVAMRADDGSTIWEYRYAAPTREQNQIRFGEGPNATPLVIGDRLITLSYSGALHALDRRTGELLWTHDLIVDFGGEVLSFGYSASPIEHDGRIIVLVGGETQSALAFAPEDGRVLWKGTPSSVSYATPRVIDVDGQSQLVYFSADEIIALDSADGRRLWSFPVVNQYLNNSTDPIWSPDNILWVATQLDGGTRALRLSYADGKSSVEEIWSSGKLSIHYWNAILIGGHVYASIGSNASILAAVDIRTGAVAWRERGFEQINMVHSGDKTVALDANGKLALLRLSPTAVEILAQAEIADGPTWTVPTLVGTRLFVRDNKSIRALDLGLPD